MFFTVWFLGFVGIILYRIFNAGMNSKELFYTLGYHSSYNDKTLMLDENKVFPYVLLTIGASFFWMLVVPTYGIFLLGRKFRKEV